MFNQTGTSTVTRPHKPREQMELECNNWTAQVSFNTHAMYTDTDEMNFTEWHDYGTGASNCKNHIGWHSSVKCLYRSSSTTTCIEHGH